MKSSASGNKGRGKAINYDRDQDLVAMYNFPLQVKRAVQEIQGVAGFMIYDGAISDQEISYLGQWLETHRAFLTQYPLSDLSKLFNEIMKDGIVEPHERRQLFDFLSSIAVGSQKNPVVNGIYTDHPQIVFKDRQFLFTGEMEFGPREKAERVVVDRGGIVAKSCTLKTNYLIVGNLGSEAYKFGRFGSKIEKAITLQREKKTPIQIVRERDFVENVVGG